MKAATGRAITTAFTALRPDWTARITPATLRADAFAGLTGATLALPQGVAFAAIAGLPPEYGFYTAIVTPVVAALTGSSWHAVSGPTTAISALVFGALAGSLAPGSPEFISAAITLALIVGVIQLALGLARMGVLVDFVSHSVMTGFVTGAAILIALSQIDKALGIELPRPEALGEFALALAEHLPDTDWRALLVAATALGIGLGVRKLNPALPNYLIALAAGIVLLDLALQAVHITNMNLIFALDDSARNRLNSGYMFLYFLGFWSNMMEFEKCHT